MDTLICKNRNEFVKDILNDISNTPSAFYYFLGKSGVGKKYVLDKIEKALSKTFKIYTVASDAILEKKKKTINGKWELNISFTIHEFMGMSLSMSKNDSTKINYIIANLNSLTLKKHILISATDYDNLSSEARDFIYILISNRKIIEEKIKKTIIVIVTGSNNYFSGKFNVIKVDFKDYSRKDLSDYLIYSLKHSPISLNNNKINQIYKLCGTNFSLVKNYYDFIIDEDTDRSIEAIIDIKMNYYITAGLKYNLSKNELEKILFVSSNSIKCLTPQIISSVTDETINTVNAGFQCAVEEYFLQKELQNSKYEHQNYIFISDIEKNYLYQNFITDNLNIFIQYYIYLTKHYEDEYFERTIFLFKYFETVNNEVFSLIILALSKSYLLNDNIMTDKIIAFFNKFNTDIGMAETFEKIIKAYSTHYEKKYKESSDILNNITFSKLNVVAAAEIRRLQIKNGQLGHVIATAKMQELDLQLRAYLDKGIILLSDVVFNPKEEKLLSLKIIFDVAPYVLDTRNDVEAFNILYDKSLLYVKYIKENFVRKSYAEYILNVFNRKAFLFAVPSVALLYYEEAESYFRNKNILEELAVTLASKAGMNIALHNYSGAIDNCNETIKIINDNQLDLLQEEKVYNNLLIAKFLEYEQNHKEEILLKKYAEKTIHKLIKLVSKEANGKNHVILTNIASLYLYIGDECGYRETKKRIEESLNCKDVSDVLNNEINDFYRYHFAWYEFYIHLIKKNWDKCSDILNNLIDFHPSIFHNKNKMSLRDDAAKYLLLHKIVPSTRDYCLHFLDYAIGGTNYSSRGLLLSDLQFTSW